MKRAATILLVASLTTVGCATFPAKRTPRLDRPRVVPELRESAPIRLVVHDRTSKPKKFEKSLGRARKKFPFLTLATEHTLDPDYTLDLSVHSKLTESGINEFAYLSMLLFPAISTEEVAARARITDADGHLLGTVESTGKCKQVAQLHLLWVLPLTVPLSLQVERKMWGNTFRDVFIQAAKIITEDQQARAHPKEVSADRTLSSSAEDRAGRAPIDRRRVASSADEAPRARPPDEDAPVSRVAGRSSPREAGQPGQRTETDDRGTDEGQRQRDDS